jgi:hypothetical protein
MIGGEKARFLSFFLPVSLSILVLHVRFAFTKVQNCCVAGTGYAPRVQLSGESSQVMSRRIEKKEAACRRGADGHWALQVY